MARDGLNGASDQGRRATFFGTKEQELPRGDGRYRINSSAKFYVAQLVCGTKGCTLDVSESAERVRHREHGQTQVEFEKQPYRLRRAENLIEFVQRFLRGGCAVYVGGKLIEQGEELAPVPFIYVATKESFRNLREFHPAAVK